SRFHPSSEKSDRSNDREKNNVVEPRKNDSRPPKDDDDIIYFRRREGHPNETDHHDKHDRNTTGTMYHERIETSESRFHPSSEKSDRSNDREKNAVVEPGLPYTERSHAPPSKLEGGGHGKNPKLKSRGHKDSITTTPSSHHDKASQRSTRGKGRDPNKRSSKGRPKSPDQNKDEESEVPWWEQSTYGCKIRTEEPKSEPKPDKDSTSRPESLTKETHKDSTPDGTATLSSHSLKARSVQEQVFSEIKAMISRFEARYGTDKLLPITPRSRQSDEMDKILESFRKLREGLFATEAKDTFAVKVYEHSVLNSLYAGNVPELTKALHHLVQELHPAVYKPKSSIGCTLLVEIPTPRQRFLGLYILCYIAKSTCLKASPTGEAPLKDSFSQTIVQPKTETDELIASLLHVYEQHKRGCKSGLAPELLFVLAYWKSLRDGSWIRRERLLEQSSVSWEQQLMVRRSMGDSLGSARTITVATMSKAYYSLPIAVMAQAVGLTGPGSPAQVDNPDVIPSDQWFKKLQSSYGLSPSVVLRDGQVMLKIKR
ncbi:hypothetical protein BGZ65_006970, partial [Modicella reniformis]